MKRLNSINRQGQLGQIITSPFILIFVFIIMSIYVFLVVTVFDIAHGVDESEFVSAEGLVLKSVSDNEILYEDGNFGSKKMFLAEAILLRFSKDLDYSDFESGLEDIFLRLNENGNMCLGIAYDTRPGALWKTKNFVEVRDEASRNVIQKSEGYGVVLEGTGSVEFNYFPFSDINESFLNDRVSLFNNGNEIFVSYFYEECSEVKNE